MTMIEDQPTPHVMRRCLARISRLPAPILYAGVVFFDKALSFISIPLMTHYLSPTDYGKLDVALSLVELCAIVLALGLSDTLIRFAGATTCLQERRQRAAELAGTAIPIVLILGVLVQLALPALMAVWKITLSETAVRISLVAAMISGFLEMPLTWMRMQDRPVTFVAVAFFRSLLQIFLLVASLSLGAGVEGWLIVSSLINIAVSLFVTGYLIRETGLRFSASMLHKLATYAMPLVGAGLAAYALSSLSRPFLSQNIASAEIAHFTIAGRLATAASLLLYPFNFWWGPKRISVLTEHNGLERSAHMWGIGIAIILLAGVLVAQLAPLFVALALPPSYLPATHYITPMIVVLGLGQLTWLFGTGIYSRHDGMYVLAIEFVAAASTIVAYYVCVPRWGIQGAIAALLFGQSARLLMTAISGHRIAPIPYGIPGAIAGMALAVVLTACAPDTAHLLGRIGWACLTVGLVYAVLLSTGVVTFRRQDLLAVFSRSSGRSP